MGEHAAMMHEWEMAPAHVSALPPSVAEAISVLGLQIRAIWAEARVEDGLLARWREPEIPC